jgi:hypothetical protein
MVVGLALVVGACTGGGEPSPSSSADEAIQMLQPDGPLGAVAIATGVGPDGSILESTGSCAGEDSNLRPAALEGIWA